ncbi:hypothetical protein CTAYLR_008741 [Chrysophaeum taylorii]|uniref:IPT/TIG domain-containing protein n=1 Tax=Chrysophaeum taylorii TaxID=2483200 RepID=A0AAD7XSS1_9STRA|nr:hypothetical protein CTAYLR_008741 [Chrysophaeum taylorii]
MGRRATKIRWEKPAQTKRDGPCARSGHTLTFVGNSGFLFGGICQDDPQQQQQQAVLKGRALDDLHVLHLGRTTEARWRRIEMPARPLARWRHSACIVNETQIVVFGGHHASNLRLNDVWVLDSVAMEWTQPYLPQAPGFTEDECHPPSTGGVPAARGGHSATVVGRGILVFGGYGGNGYSRRDHDDLHRLDVDDWKWSRLEPTGCGPERRCGHQACAVESRLFVWGGWNVSKRFADVFVLDFSGVLAWSKVGDLREPRWNAASCGVLAIPHWKIFAFGGSRRRRGGPSLVVVDHEDLGVPCDDVSIFDAGTLKWTTPEDVGAEEDAPSARCDSALAFDPKSSKLVLFGGWSNQWLDDLYALDVSLVVGPPYAVTDVHPATGPVTGGTVLEITGYDFVETQDVTVRFASSDRARDVKGTFESKTRLWCETPEFFETPGDVQVRVALDDDSFTSTFRHFAYFSVTDAAWSLIYGPGVLSGGTSGEETVFRVQARDKDNRNRTTGGDEFKVVITHVGGGDDGDDDDIQQIRNFSVNDIGDGAYEVTYVPPEPGEYLIVVEFLGTHRGAKGAVRGSGAVVEFKEFAPRSNNSFAGKLVRQALEKDSSRITALVDEIGSGIHAVSHSDEYTEVQNRNALVWVKEHLNMVFEKRHEIELAMDRVACTLAALEAVGAAAAIGPLRTRLDEQREAWTACQRDAPKIAAAISPLLKAQATRTRGEIDEYQTKARAMLDAARAGPWVAYDVGASRATELLDNAWAGFKAEEKRCEDTARLAKLFGCAEEFKASNELVATAGNTLRAYSDLWKCAAECDAYVREAADMFWDDIEPKGLIENARLVLNKVRSQSKLVKRSDAYAELEKYAYDFLAACPFVASLKQPTIEPRHWRELQEVAEVVATSNHAAPPAPVMTEKTTLGDVLRLELPRHADRVHEIIEKATSEAAQEETLRVISAFWSAAKFVVRKTNHVSTPLLSLTEKDADQLESDQVALQALVASRFDFSKARAAEWQTKLTTVSDALAAIRHVQDVWTYLHPLFGECEEVFNELPEETARFERVEQRVQAILERLAEFGFVVAACTQEDGLADSLSAAARDLDVAHQDLADFLNRKCRSFPRFYFVGERTLVSILSRASNPIAVVEEHVPDLFLATASFRLEDDAADVESRPRAIEFESAIGAECVKFDRAVRLDGKVETYLQTLFNAQASALRKRLQMSLERYPTQTRTQWVQESEAKTKGRFVDPSQIALLVAGANFAGSVEDAINAVASGEHEALQNYAERHDGDLHDLVLIARTSLTPTERQRLSNLICQDAHGRDVLRRLVDDSRTRHKDDFLWQSQLKWRSIEQDTGRPTIKVETCDAAWEYEFEYVGNGSRIVVTPLTEKCFVAIARTLVVNIGCAVMGPACCGKSETIKAMGLAMGKLSYVFGCSPEYDCTSLGRLIKGVAASGAWLLLEDFDRVAPSVLSVCAVHFKAISEGLARLDGDADAKFYISIDGESTVLHHKATTLVTQDASHGRRRPIAILKPDVRLICEVSMMAQGFVAFKPLASKLCGVNCMFEELLPKRRHYDWSLHSLAPILAVAGRTKRMMPEMPEEALVMQVVRDFNRSKFAREDDEIVDEILSNAFPSAQRPPHLSDDALDRLIFRATEEDELWPDDGFRLKVAQLDELLSIRHSVYLVGERGVGKTTIWKTLKHTYAIKDDPPEHHVAVIFPKVFTTKHLYGHIDPRSREWKDGIFAVTLREIIRKLPTTTNWVVLDGEVDPGWTESIESALDETRILPLASNERIRIPQNTRFLFETTDLRFASPAAVSRAAMLYVRADKGKQWQAVTACWVQLRSDEAFSDDNRRSIATMFETYVSPALEFLHSNARGLAVPADDTSLVVRLLVMLEATLTPTALLKESRLETTFVFCCVWAFGSALAVGNDGRDYRKIFSEWWRNTFKQVRMPGKDTVFDYWLEPAKGVFETWRQSPTFSKIDYDSIQMRMDTIMVPTTETASVTFWMDLFLRKCTPLSLVGPSGVGKTLIVTQALRSFEEQQETRHRRRHFATFAIAAPSGAFPMSVSDVAPTVLKATLAVHKECCVAFRKTAANPLFFGFNARHVASVCRGLLLAQPKSGQFDFPEMVIKLWCHEVERAYGDVLTTETDVLKLREIVRSTAKKSFLTINTAELLGDAERDPSDNGDAPSVLCFCHVRDAETLVEPCYGQLEQLTEVRTAITRSLSEYNEGPHPKLDVILFEDALFHIARIMRIILQPAGHALLLGRGGSGPKFYLDMVDSFVDQFKKARATSIEATTIYENGLEKLRDAVTSLATLDHDIRVWKKDADYKQEIAAELGQRVKQDSEILEKEIAVKEAKDAKVATIEADVKRRTEDAEAELALAAPAVDALNSALDMLTREELGECKEMPTLPRGAGDVWSAVCVLLAGINSGVAVQKDGNVRENDRSWDACKRSLLANINGLIEELSHFKSLIDEGRVPRVNFKFVRAFLRLEHFTEEAMESQLPVAACLVRWVRNAVIYFDKWLDVEPKRLKIVQATKRLREAQAALEEQVKLVEKLQSQLDRLKAEFEEAETARAVAAEKATRGQLKLELGQRLIDAVGLECERWESNLQRVVAERELLVGNALLAAAFACYCGALDPLRRQQLVYESWLPYLETAMPNGCGIPVVPHDRQQTVSLLATNSDVTTLTAPMLPAELQSELMVVEFAVTDCGLEDHLVGFIFRTEDPDLAIRRVGLLAQVCELQLRICEIEDQILDKLNLNDVEPAEDRELIDTLEHLAIERRDAVANVAASQTLADSVRALAERFREVARRGRAMFSLMRRLSCLDGYYVYSLNLFVVLFQLAIDAAFEEEQREKVGASIQSKLKLAAKKAQAFSLNPGLGSDEISLFVNAQPCPHVWEGVVMLALSAPSVGKLEPLAHLVDEMGHFAAAWHQDESLAEESIGRMAEIGGWIVLKNVHLTPHWIPTLERKLEIASASASINFRCFLTAEPALLPESLHVKCVKIADQIQQDLDLNALRAAVSVAPKGDGDKLRIQWDSLTRNVGDVVYSGGVPDYWDHQIITTYLAPLFDNAFLEPNARLVHSDCSAPEITSSYAFIERYLEAESEFAEALGMPELAARDFSTATASRLVEGVSRFIGGGVRVRRDDPRAPAMEIVQSFEENMPHQFPMASVRGKASNVTEDAPEAPYVVVAVRECDRANALVEKLIAGLDIVRKSLSGQIDTTPEMDELAESLAANQVPGSKPFHRISWLAWPTRKTAAAWFADLRMRFDQLGDWEAKFELPLAMWFAFFNAQDFLTAIKLFNARLMVVPLDKMALETHVCASSNTYLLERPTRGVFIRGLFCQGATWAELDSHEYAVDNVHYVSRRLWDYDVGAGLAVLRADE